MRPEDVEPDDDLHNPDVEDEKPRCCGINKRGSCVVLALACFIVGLMSVYIAFPVRYVDFPQPFVRTSNLIACHIDERPVSFKDPSQAAATIQCASMWEIYRYSKMFERR